MRILAHSRTIACVKIGTSRQVSTVQLGELPRAPRAQGAVIEMQPRKPGEAGAQVRLMTRPIARVDHGPDADYED